MVGICSSVVNLRGGRDTLERKGKVEWEEVLWVFYLTTKNQTLYN